MIVKLSKNSGDHQQIQVILSFDPHSHRRWKVLWAVAGQRRHPWTSLHVNQDDDQGGLQLFKPSWTHETKPTHTWVPKVFVVVGNFVKKKLPHILRWAILVIPYFGKLSLFLGEGEAVGR